MTERRSYTLESVAVLEQPSGLGFRGMAAVFDDRVWIGPPGLGFHEEIAPGAFTRAIHEDDVRFLVDHDPTKVLARTTSGTLRLQENRTGLAVDADMADVSYARDLSVLLGRRDVNQMSFGFLPRRLDKRADPPAGWNWELDRDNAPVGAMWTTVDGQPLRRCIDLQTFDVSAVAFPAYDGTEAALRVCEARRAGTRDAQFRALRARLDAAYGNGEDK